MDDNCKVDKNIVFQEFNKWLINLSISVWLASSFFITFNGVILKEIVGKEGSLRNLFIKFSLEFLICLIILSFVEFICVAMLITVSAKIKNTLQKGENLEMQIFSSKVGFNWSELFWFKKEVLKNWWLVIKTPWGFLIFIFLIFYIFCWVLLYIKKVELLNNFEIWRKV
jgi:hypothetical protein